MQPGSVSMSATTGKTTYIRPEFLSCCLICGKTKNKKETHFRSLGADSKDEVERVAAGWVKDYIGLVVSQAVCCRNCFLRMESLDIKVKRLRESCKKTLESLTVTVTTGSGGSVTLNESEVERLTGFGCCTSDSEIDRFPAKLWFPLQLKPEVDLPEGITTSQASFIVEKNDSSDADSSVPSCDEDEQHKEGAESSRRRPAGNFVHLKNRTSPSDEQPELDSHVLSEGFGAHSSRPVADGHKLEPGEIPARPGPSLSPPIIVSTLSKEKTTPVQCKRGPGRPRKRPLSPNSVMLEHPLVPVYPCDHCSGMFKNLKDYDTHVKSHNDLLKKKKKMKGLELIRPKLKKRRNAELKAETQSLLGISGESAKPKQLRLTKLHRCTACPRKYRTKMLLINHVALIHERACLMCGFEVYSGRVLQEHKLVCKGMIGRNQDMLTST